MKSSSADKNMHNVGRFSVEIPVQRPVLWFGGYINLLSTLTNTPYCMMGVKEKKNGALLELNFMPGLFKRENSTT